MSLRWAEINELVRIGKAYSGGLGRSAVKNHYGDYQLWMCLRDWNFTEMRSCGVGFGQFACFRFEERSEVFEPWGTAETLRILSKEQIQDSIEKEDQLTNHNSPTKKLPKPPACHDGSMCNHADCRAWLGRASCSAGRGNTGLFLHCWRQVLGNVGVLLFVISFHVPNLFCCLSHLSSRIRSAI